MTDTAVTDRPQSEGRHTTFRERIDAILPGIAGRVSETEEARSLPNETVEALRGAGVFRSLVPAAYGGDEVDFWEFLQSIRALARVCPSTGWIAGVTATHAHGVAAYTKRAQDDVWADGPDTIICSSVAAVVTAKRVDGGYRLTGNWDFSSGSDYATWVQLGFRVEGRPEEETYLGLVPRSDYEVTDNWYTVGMRGTGSKRITVSDIFVPDYRCWGPGLMAPHFEPDLHDSYLFKIPYLGGAAFFTAVLLGTAEGGLAAYREALMNRIRPHTGKPRLDNPMSYVRLAESSLDIRTAALIFERRWEAIINHAKAGTHQSMDEAFATRGDDAYAARMAVTALDRLMNAGGGSAAMLSRPLQQYWRDIHTAANHVFFDLENRLIIVGRHLVGLPPDLTLL